MVYDIFDVLESFADSFMIVDNYADSSYPKYNSIKVDNETQVLELALAGWNKDEVKVELDDGVLIVSGKKNNNTEEPEYTHKGIANRDFIFKKALNRYWYVQKVSMEDGMLRIRFHLEVPEEAKPKVFQIN